MKHPAVVRDRLLARVLDMLEHFRLQLTLLPDTEHEVLRQIERPQQHDVAVDVTNFVMGRLGHACAPKDPRFDKTRRAAAKKGGIDRRTREYRQQKKEAANAPSEG